LPPYGIKAADEEADEGDFRPPAPAEERVERGCRTDKPNLRAYGVGRKADGFVHFLRVRRATHTKKRQVPARKRTKASVSIPLIGPSDVIRVIARLTED
jgi:hypothetical protein